MAAGLREFPGAGGFEKHSIARTPAQGQPGADTKKAKAPAPGLAGRDYKAPVPSAGRRSPPLCSLQGILSGLQGHACLLFPRPVWAGKGPDAPADSPPCRRIPTKPPGVLSFIAHAGLPRPKERGLRPPPPKAYGKHPGHWPGIGTGGRRIPPDPAEAGSLPKPGRWHPRGSRWHNLPCQRKNPH